MGQRGNGEMVLAEEHLPDTKFSHVKNFIFKVLQNSHRTMLNIPTCELLL
jgi:hypothetical protein